MESWMMFIPLIMSIIIIIQITGFASLAFIHYQLKDKLLSRNIFLTLVASAILPLLNWIVTIIVGLILLAVDYPESLIGFSLRSLWDDILELFLESLISMFFTLALGVLFAFVVVVPITLAWRHFKKSKETQESGT